MIYVAGESAYVSFGVSDSTGAARAADSTPTATLYRNGASTGTVVTVTSAATGAYVASFTVPAYTAGDELELLIVAVVDGLTYRNWKGRGKVDTLVSTVAGMSMTLADGAITAAKIATGAIDADALSADAVAEIAAAVQAQTSLADLATMVTGDGTGSAIFTEAALGNAPTQAAVLHEGIYTVLSEDAGADGTIRSFVGDTRRVLLRVQDRNGSIIPLAGTVTLTLVNVSTGTAGDPITVTTDSIAGNVGRVDIPTPTAGRFRASIRMVNGGLTTTAGPIIIIVSAR